QLLVLFALPCVFRRLDHGQLSPGHFYAAWWIMGMMPVLFEMLDRPMRFADPQPRSPAPGYVYLVLPWISLAAHLGILHYVYDVHFYAAHAAPILLGFAVVLGRIVPNGFVRAHELATIKL